MAAHVEVLSETTTIDEDFRRVMVDEIERRRLWLNQLDVMARARYADTLRILGLRMERKPDQLTVSIWGNPRTDERRPCLVAVWGVERITAYLPFPRRLLLSFNNGPMYPFTLEDLQGGVPLPDAPGFNPRRKRYAEGYNPDVPALDAEAAAAGVT